DKWLPTLKTRAVPVRGKDDPAAELRGLVWAPLEKHLVGASTVLVSPDGALGRLPWAALPGADPKQYLLEERTLAVLPTPQLLPQLMARSAAKDEAPSLLLVGDVDFDAAPGAGGEAATSRSAARTSGLRRWGRLGQTRVEVVAIKDTFARRFRAGK